MVTPKEAALAVFRRVQREIGETSAEAARRRSLLGRAAGLLRGMGATRVVLFGSLAGGAPHSRSDVDLAVEGLPAEAGSAAHRQLADLFQTDNVDLVELERAPKALRAIIERYGEEIR